VEKPSTLVNQSSSLHPQTIFVSSPRGTLHSATTANSASSTARIDLLEFTNSSSVKGKERTASRPSEPRRSLQYHRKIDPLVPLESTFLRTTLRRRIQSLQSTLATDWEEFILPALPSTFSLSILLLHPHRGRVKTSSLPFHHPKQSTISREFTSINFLLNNLSSPSNLVFTSSFPRSGGQEEFLSSSVFKMEKLPVSHLGRNRAEENYRTSRMKGSWTRLE